jgi:hypothetical protein
MQNNSKLFTPVATAEEKTEMLQKALMELFTAFYQELEKLKMGFKEQGLSDSDIEERIKVIEEKQKKEAVDNFVKGVVTRSNQLGKSPF